MPLRDEMLRERVRQEILEAYLHDNRKARILLKDATYIRAWQSPRGKTGRPPTGAAAFSSQDFLMSVAEGKASVPIPAAVPPHKRSTLVRREP